MTENHIRGLLGGGDRLDARLRAAFERAYGTDLSAIRIHTDDRANDLCRTFAAEAFTVGSDIFFAAGAYAPHAPAGLELLAHEIAHAVDQGGARLPAAAGAIVSEPGDACEGDARGRAAAFLRGTPVPPSASRVRPLADDERLVLQRHASWEHRLLGDAPPADLNVLTTTRGQDRILKLQQLRDFLAMWKDNPDSVNPDRIKARYPTIRTVQLGTSGLLVTYGELNTLADYLATPAALDSQPRAILEPILQSVRQESFYWVDKLLGTDVSGSAGKFKNSIAANIGWEFLDLLIETKAIDNLTANLGWKGIDHYSAVVGRNACHFAPYSWYRWEQSHLIARDYATQAYHSTGSAKDRLTNLAWINHGYADHFLQDSFASGHLVNKTLIMQWFLEWANTGILGNAMPVADWQMVRRMMTTADQGGLAARALYDGFADPAKRGVVRDPQTAEEQWALERRITVSGVRRADFRSDVDAYKHYLRLINNAGVQLSSGILHDHYTEEGLYVASVDHPTAFQIYGDCTMMNGGDGVRIAAETAQLSQAALGDLLARGTTSITTQQIFNRFPTKVRGARRSGAPEELLSLQEWNESRRDTAISLFPSPKIAAARGLVQRIGKISIDVTGGWGWQQVIGASAKDIAVGGDGSAWIITSTKVAGGYTIKKLQGSTWTAVDGGATRIAVDGAGTPWVVNDTGAIFRRDNGKWQYVGVDGILSGKDKAGQNVSGASDIGAGTDGTVWVLGRTAVTGGHPIYRWNGTKWQQSTGAAVSISVAPNGLPWVTNDQNSVYRMKSGALLGKDWERLAGKAIDVGASTGVLPTAWCIGDTKINDGGNGIFAWNGEGWDQISGAATRIAVGPDGTPWVVNGLDNIYQLVPTNASRVEFTTQDAGKVRGRAVAKAGSLFPGDTVMINGSTDLSRVIVGNSGACIYSLTMDTTAAYYDFLVQADGRGPSGPFSGTLWLKFVDETGDVYSLSLFLSDRRTHEVRFDSTRPGIREIQWSDSMF
ncbi:eCIS core domain-containing protein [Actinopolymorpha pittospori]